MRERLLCSQTIIWLKLRLDFPNRYSLGEVLQETDVLLREKVTPIFDRSVAVSFLQPPADETLLAIGSNKAG